MTNVTANNIIINLYLILSVTFLNDTVNIPSKVLIVLIDLTQKYGIPIQASAFLGTSPIRQFVENWDMDFLVKTMGAALDFARNHEIPVMFVTEDTTRSRPEDLRRIYTRAIELGAGEVLLTSMDADGTLNGYDIALTRTVAETVSVPVIASGGAGTCRGMKSAG